MTITWTIPDQTVTFRFAPAETEGGTGIVSATSDGDGAITCAARSNTQCFSVAAAPSSLGATWQTLADSCVTAGGTRSIPIAGSKRPVKPDCVSNSDQTISVRLNSARPWLSQRGDLRYCDLYCQDGNRKTTTKATGYGGWLAVLP